MATYRADFVITRNGRALHRSSWFSDDTAVSSKGWCCSHACGLAEPDDDSAEPCGWCESQGLDPVKRPRKVVECPNCQEVYRDDSRGGDLSFLAHLLDECFQ